MRANTLVEARIRSMLRKVADVADKAEMPDTEQLILNTIEELEGSFAADEDDEPGEINWAWVEAASQLPDSDHD